MRVSIKPSSAFIKSYGYCVNSLTKYFQFQTPKKSTLDSKKKEKSTHISPHILEWKFHYKSHHIKSYLGPFYVFCIFLFLIKNWNWYFLVAAVILPSIISYLTFFLVNIPLGFVIKNNIKFRMWCIYWYNINGEWTERLKTFSWRFLVRKFKLLRILICLIWLDWYVRLFGYVHLNFTKNRLKIQRFILRDLMRPQKLSVRQPPVKRKKLCFSPLNPKTLCKNHEIPKFSQTYKLKRQTVFPLDFQLIS